MSGQRALALLSALKLQAPSATRKPKIGPESAALLADFQCEAAATPLSAVLRLAQPAPHQPKRIGEGY